jgi:hypothetical protein
MFCKLFNTVALSTLVLAPMVAGCSSSEPSAPSPSTKPANAQVGGNNGSETGGSNGSGSSPAEEGSPSASISNAPCTEKLSICTTYSLPKEMTGKPSRIFIGFYKKLPPAGPPDVFGSEVKDVTSIKAGEPVSVKQTGISGLEGSFFVYSVLYMEGGGQFLPKPGIDLVSISKEPTVFDGTAKTISGLNFTVATK